MNKENVLKSLRFNFITSIFSAVIAIAAFETGYLTKGVLAMNLGEQDIYYIEVSAIMLTIAIVPFAIKGFSRAMNKVAGQDNITVLKLYGKKSIQRMFLLFIALVVNIFVYYGIKYDGAIYCGIVCLGALIYSYPTEKVLNDYLEGNQTK
ncbi:MAG: hypothetical protein IIV04_03665 [Bacteroidaceae bacterium]|jgi:hypothetical protein|nr:hypothetical protein [Bacteroidaceae bacterium]